MNIDIPKILAKGAGLAGLGLVLYDSHMLGKIESDSFQKHHSANLIAGPFANTETLSSPSIVTARAKKGFFNFMMEESITEFFTSITGYLKGFGSMIVSDIIPLGLSLGALLTRGKLSKAFGLGLLGYGVIFMLRDVMGIGKPKELVEKF